MRRVPIPSLLTAAVVILVLLAYALTFQVRFSEVAIKFRLGKVAAIVTEPGLYPRWPWPIENIRKYDKRLRTLDTAESEIKTKDGKNVIAGNYAVWRIEDPLQFYVQVTTVARAEEQLRARIAQRRAAVIAAEPLSALVNLNEEIVNASYERMQRELMFGLPPAEAEGRSLSLYDGVKADFGIHLEKVAIRRISLPEETNQSVFQQMSAERQAEAARYREEGKSRAATITAEAEAAKKQILEFAKTKAEKERSKGVDAATRVLAQITAADVDFFEWLRWLDALRVSLKQKSTIFLDQKSEFFQHFVQPPASIVPATRPTEK